MTKKFNKLLLVLLLVVLVPFVSTAISCKKKVSSITLVTNTTTYNIGDELNVNDFSILVTYEDNKTENVTVTTEMLKEALPVLENEGSYTITVNYEKEEYTVTINVVNPKKISTISASNYRTEYFIDDEFTANGNLTIQYQNTAIQNDTINITEAMISERPDTTTVGEKIVVITYNGFTCNYKITVREKTITSVHLESTPTFYNTAKQEDINLENNRLVIQYEDGTTEYYNVTTDMISFVPDFTEKRDEYRINIDVLGHTYAVPVEIEIDPEYAEYQAIIEAIKTVLKNGAVNGANIDASAILKVTSKIMGETEEVNESFNTTFKLEEIPDIYLKAIAEDMIDSIFELSNYPDFASFIKGENINIDIDTMTLAMTFVNKFIATTTEFDFYAYINSYPELVEYKNAVTEVLTSIINDITFGFEDDVYVEELQDYQYTEEYETLYNIVEDTIVKEIILRTFDGQRFLSEFRDYANSFAEKYPDLVPATINVIDGLVNTDGKHIISNFIMNELAVQTEINIMKNDNDTNNLTILGDFGETIKIIEDFIFENIEPMELPENLVKLICDIAYTDAMDDYELDYLDLECTLAQAEIEFDAENESFDDLAERLNTELENCELYTYEYYMITYSLQYLDEMNEDLDRANTICEIRSILMDYTHKLVYGDDIDYCQLTIDALTALGLDDGYYQNFYDENGYIPLLKNLASLLLYSYNDELTNLGYIIHEDNVEVLKDFIISIADRIDQSPITETDLTSDLFLIAYVTIYNYTNTDASILLSLMYAEKSPLFEILEVDDYDYHLYLNRIVKDIDKIVLGYESDLYVDMYNLAMTAINYKSTEHLEELFLEDVYEKIVEVYDAETNEISSEDMKTIIRILANNFDLNENNPYYTAFEMILNSDEELDINALELELEYATLISNKNLIISLFFEMLDEMGVNLDNEDLNFEVIYNITENFFVDTIEYLYKDGEEVDVVKFIIDLTEQFKEFDLGMAIVNRYAGSYSLNRLAYVLLADFSDLLYENELPETLTENDQNLIASIKSLGTIIDTYFMPYSNPEEDDVNPDELLNQTIENTMALFKEVAIEKDSLPAYLISDIYYQFANQELTEEIIVDKINKLSCALELAESLGIRTIEEYQDIYNLVETFYDATEISTTMILDTLVTNNTFMKFASMAMIDILGITEQDEAVDAYYNLVDDLVSAYSGDEYVAQDLAQEYFDFVTNYVNEEDRPVFYGMAVVTLVMNDIDVDYNELFKDVKLPEGVGEVNYNNVIKLLITKETILNAIKYEGIKEVIEYTEDGTLISQTFTIKITLDFDITFVVLNGSLDLVLELTY